MTAPRYRPGAAPAPSATCNAGSPSVMSPYRRSSPFGGSQAGGAATRHPVASLPLNIGEKPSICSRHLVAPLPPALTWHDFRTAEGAATIQSSPPPLGCAPAPATHPPRTAFAVTLAFAGRKPSCVVPLRPKSSIATPRTPSASQSLVGAVSSPPRLLLTGAAARSAAAAAAKRTTQTKPFNRKKVKSSTAKEKWTACQSPPHKKPPTALQ